MHPLQHLVNFFNQMLAALFAIFLAIWLKLRNARKAKGLTIEGAAELFEVSPVTYSRWERLCQRPHPYKRGLKRNREQKGDRTCSDRVKSDNVSTHHRRTNVN